MSQDYPPIEYLQSPGPELWNLYPLEVLLLHRRRVAWYLHCWDPSKRVGATRRWWRRFQEGTPSQLDLAWEVVVDVLPGTTLESFYRPVGDPVPLCPGSKQMAEWLWSRMEITRIHPDWCGNSPGGGGQGRGRALALFLDRGLALPETVPTTPALLWCYWSRGEYGWARPGQWLRAAARTLDGSLVQQILQHWPSLRLVDCHYRLALRALVERAGDHARRQRDLQARGATRELELSPGVEGFLQLAELWRGGPLRTVGLLRIAFQHREDCPSLLPVWNWIWESGGMPGSSDYYALFLDTLQGGGFSQARWLMERGRGTGLERMVYPGKATPHQAYRRWGALAVPAEDLEGYSAWLSLEGGTYSQETHYYTAGQMGDGVVRIVSKTTMLHSARVIPPICPPLDRKITREHLGRMSFSLALEQLSYRGDSEGVECLLQGWDPVRLVTDYAGSRAVGARMGERAFYYQMRLVSTSGLKCRGRERYLVERWSGFLVCFDPGESRGLHDLGEGVYYRWINGRSRGGSGRVVEAEQEILGAARRYRLEYMPIRAKSAR